jgi:hypothetical protein
MAEVTYFVALPFVASDDGVAAGEPTECFNPVAVAMRGGFIAQGGPRWSRRVQPHRRVPEGRFQRCQSDQEIR